MGAQVQVANLEARAQNVQLRVGIAMVSVALCVGMLLNHLGASRGAHVALVPLFFVGVYGLSAALLRTCGISAFLGQRRTECGVEPVADRAELSALRRRGALVIAASFLVAVVASGVLALAD